MTPDMPTGELKNQNPVEIPNPTPVEQTEGFPSPDNPLVPHSGQLSGSLRDLPLREFNKPLEEAHNEGLIKTPESPRDLHRISRLTRAGIAAGGLIIALGSIVGAVKALGGGEDAPAANNSEPTASAPANPGEKPSEAPTNNPTTPETNTPGAVTLETLNTPPNSEVIKEALKPVTVAEYPNPEDAIARIGQNWNAQMLSGSIDDSGFDLKETAQSLELRNKLWRNIMGSHVNDQATLLGEANQYRYNLARAFWQLEANARPGDAAPYWQQSMTATQVNKTSPNAYNFTVREDFETNLGEVFDDADEFFSNPTSHSVTAKGQLVIEDGEYHIVSLEELPPQ